MGPSGFILVTDAQRSQCGKHIGGDESIERQSIQCWLGDVTIRRQVLTDAKLDDQAASGETEKKASVTTII